MKDGLYRVGTSYLAAGFVVKDGVVTHCAPILRRKLDYWKTVATLICSREATDASPSDDVHRASRNGMPAALDARPRSLGP